MQLPTSLFFSTLLLVADPNEVHIKSPPSQLGEFEIKMRLAEAMMQDRIFYFCTRHLQNMRPQKGNL